MNGSQPVLTQLSQQDVILQKIIATIPMPTYESTQDVFHDLLSCILEQQIHYRSTKKTFQKMLDASGLVRLSPTNFQEFEDKAFANIKLSGSKYETILRILEFWKGTSVDWATLSDAEVREALASIKGIGPWTIDMILLYTLERPNVLPTEDYHLKQIMTQLYQLNANVKLKAQMLAVAEAWVPYRSLAVQYLLAWKNVKQRSNIFE